MNRIRAALGIYESPYRHPTPPSQAEVIAYLDRVKPSPDDLFKALRDAIQAGHWKVINRYLPRLPLESQSDVLELCLCRGLIGEANELHSCGIRIVAPDRCLRRSLSDSPGSTAARVPSRVDMDIIGWLFEHYNIDELRIETLGPRFDDLWYVLFFRPSHQMLRKMLQVVPLGRLKGSQWYNLAQAQYFGYLPPEWLEWMPLTAQRAIAKRKDTVRAALRPLMSSDLAGYLMEAF